MIYEENNNNGISRTDCSNIYIFRRDYAEKSF